MMRPKLGIIAGGGALPGILIKNCERETREFVVVALKGQADPETVHGRSHRWFRLGAAGEALAYLKQEKVEELVFAGSVRKPAAADLRPDFWTTRFLARGNIYGMGDDGLLSQLITHLERVEGFHVVKINDIAPELLAPSGTLTLVEPTEADLADIAVGATAACELGRQDKGQGVIVAEGEVIAREGRLGTDAMMAELPTWTVSQERRGILVKMLKPEQELRADQPTIGPATVDVAKRYGLHGIAVDAGNALILDRAEMLTKANNAGIFIYGLDATQYAEAFASPLIYLIAGEPSADNLGARLMIGLKQATRAPLRFAGVGGPAMSAEGLKSLFPMEDLTVMGLAEVLPRLPALRRRILQTKADILARQPNVVIGIDSPDFNFRVAGRLAGHGIPLMHFVAPSVWAWRSGRAKKIAGFLDHLLALLPFEPPYFEKHGLATTYVGHPVLECRADQGDGPAFRQARGIGDDERILLVLAGSRQSEAACHLPVFAETVKRLHDKIDALRVITVTAPSTEEIVSQAVNQWPCEVITLNDPSHKFDAFAASDVALAASGTVALELAMAMVPSVIAYRMNPVTAWLAKRLVKVRYANLVNLILEREAVPEFLLDRCKAELIAPAIMELLTTPERRQRQKDDYFTALTKLGRDDEPAGQRAAKAVLDFINATKNNEI